MLVQGTWNSIHFIHGPFDEIAMKCIDSLRRNTGLFMSITNKIYIGLILIVTPRQ
jgi:hypothetical protein